MDILKEVFAVFSSNEFRHYKKATRKGFDYYWLIYEDSAMCYKLKANKEEIIITTWWGDSFLELDLESNVAYHQTRSEQILFVVRRFEEWGIFKEKYTPFEYAAKMFAKEQVKDPMEHGLVFGEKHKYLLPDGIIMEALPTSITVYSEKDKNSKVKISSDELSSLVVDPDDIPQFDKISEGIKDQLINCYYWTKRIYYPLNQ